MATYTTNWNLKKPAASDKASIADINSNMDILDAACGFIVKSWTPQLYDNTSYVRDLSNGLYAKIGRVVIAFYSTSSANLSGISTMLQIRNLPMTTVYGGSVYFGELQQSSLTRPVYVQSGTSYLYARPNVKSSDFSSASSTAFGFMIIGTADSY